MNALIGLLIANGIDLDLNGMIMIDGGGIKFNQESTQKVFRAYCRSESVADDGTITLPTAKTGFVLVTTGAEGGLVSVAADGTCVKLAGTTNLVVTDSDTDLCVYDGGTGAVVKNRLGSSQTVTVIFFYF